MTRPSPRQVNTVHWLINLDADDGILNSNVEHDIITRDANSVSRAEIWKFSKSQRDIIDVVKI